MQQADVASDLKEFRDKWGTHRSEQVMKTDKELGYKMLWEHLEVTDITLRGQRGLLYKGRSGLRPGW